MTMQVRLALPEIDTDSTDLRMIRPQLLFRDGIFKEIWTEIEEELHRGNIFSDHPILDAWGLRLICRVESEYLSFRPVSLIPPTSFALHTPLMETDPALRGATSFLINFEGSRSEIIEAVTNLCDSRGMPDVRQKRRTFSEWLIIQNKYNLWKDCKSSFTKFAKSICGPHRTSKLESHKGTLSREFKALEDLLCRPNL